MWNWVEGLTPTPNIIFLQQVLSINKVVYVFYFVQLTQLSTVTAPKKFLSLVLGSAPSLPNKMVFFSALRHGMTLPSFKSMLEYYLTIATNIPKLS